MSTDRTFATDDRAAIVARIAVLVTIAIVAATAVWLGLRGEDVDAAGGDQTQGATSGNHAGSTSGGSEQLAPPDAQTAPADGVTLPTGSTQTDGYLTGFPYTDLGAVALQVELAKAQIGFDYHQAAAVARLYAHPKDRSIFEDRSRDAVALRRQQAGVPADGEVPSPASYAATPVAFTREELDTDYYVVNLLSYITLTTTDAEARDGLYAGTQLVRWVADPDADSDSDVDNGGDWKVVQGSSTDLQKLVADGQPRAVAPGTPEFVQAGWVMIDTATTSVGDNSSETGDSS